MRRNLAALAWALAGVLTANAAQATLMGDTIDVQYVWPNVGSVYQDLGTVTASSTPQTVTFQPYFNVVVSATSIVVNASNFTVTYSNSFNGEYVIDKSVTTFPNYTVDLSTYLPGGSPVITAVGNTLEINFAGRAFLPGSQLVLDIGATSAPEPATFGILAASMASIAFFRRRRTA